VTVKGINAVMGYTCEKNAHDTTDYRYKTNLFLPSLYFTSLPNALVFFIVNSTGDALLYAAILYGAMLCDAMWCNVFSSLKM
jgi:hypothetical protein